MQPITHIAIIPDGNRRWAKSRGAAPWEGHRFGIDKFKETSKDLFSRGVPFATFWALSKDNLLKRSPIELEHLFAYLKADLGSEETVKDFIDNGIRVRVVGEWNEAISDDELKEIIKALEERTRDCKKGLLTILFVYDGMAEMIEAVKAVSKTGNISQEALKESLWTGYLPPVDLVIRTGGEPHWSAGFMMWLTANSEFHFSPLMWPEFGKDALEYALREYDERRRRGGK